MPLLHRLAHTPLATPYIRGLLALFDARISGADRIPRAGAALIVSNHACLGLDSFAFTPLCIREVGRMPRFLGERNLWRVPGLAQLLDSIGAVPGSQRRAVQLLNDGELVAVYPGGIDDSFKLSAHAYELMWKQRAGFASVALRASVPIIPVVGEGIDDQLTIVRREPWIGRRLLGSDRYDLPWAIGAYGIPFLPRRVPLVFHVLEPILPHGDANSEADVQRHRDRVFHAMDRVLSVLRQLRTQRRSGRVDACPPSGCRAVR